MGTHTLPEQNEEAANFAKRKYNKLKSPEAQNEWNILKHPILPPCIGSTNISKKGCAKDCSLKFSLAEREQIHTEFWSFKYNEQISWLSRECH